jgi:hypothetical protein
MAGSISIIRRAYKEMKYHTKMFSASLAAIYGNTLKPNAKSE